MRLALLVTAFLFWHNVINAQNILYRYDNMGRLVQITYPNANAVSYTYDKDGNRIYHETAIDSSVLPHVGAITGPSSVCVGATISLSDTAFGGAWSASNPSAAVSGGIVTGASVGLDTISYTLTNSYGSTTVTKIITVTPLPSAGTITGPSSVCVSATAPLVDLAPGGTWSTSNGDATLSGSIVIGVSTGIDIISYTVTNSCGTAYATKTMTVAPLPSAGAIGGNSNVCEGMTINLSDLVPGGKWSANNPSASVTSVGLVTGISAGADVISYAVSNSCGVAYATFPITIFSADACNSAGVHSASNAADFVKVYPNPTEGTFTVEMPNANSSITITIFDAYGQTVETRKINAVSGLKESFNLEKLSRGTYLIKMNVGGETYEDKIAVW